jgi:hypothetical protein
MLALAAMLDVVSSPFTLASLLLVLGLWVVMLRPDAHEIVGRVWRTASGRSTPSPANANPLMPGLLLIGLITCTFMLFFNLTNVLVRPGVRLGGQKLLCTRDVCSTPLRVRSPFRLQRGHTHSPQSPHTRDPSLQYFALSTLLNVLHATTRLPADAHPLRSVIV